MTGTTHEYERFVRRAHRRWVAWRAVERAGLTVLGACALSLPLIAVLWLEGEPALRAVAPVLAIGALVGAVWGAVNRPTLLGTAAEADRQFNLHDLLGTALTLSRCTHVDDPMRGTIVALADERCRHAAASRLVLNKLGARTWGGIGLATALVLTLALMTASPATPVAHADDAGRAFVARGSQNSRATAPTMPRMSPDRIATSSRSSDAAPTPARGDQTHGDAPSSPTRAATDAPHSADGAGSAAGQSASRDASTPRPVAPGDDGPTGSTPGVGDGGARDTRPIASDDRAGTGVARPMQSARETPPWRSPTWETDRARAMRDVERGDVPDAYRDLVRAYFQEN